MADVLLREYIEQLRAHIQARQLSDAFALGRHILRYYPKHIETYVTLAQASLEADDLAGATDLFRRVLSADPENVVALAGMALIHETQNRNDEALWYLERAYEMQPTNDDLRRELTRVRELYYGADTERLELTSGALARIYARQGQYASAVNEFRRLLRQESQRYDARVALAETLYRAGRADEAAQLAQNIMVDAPYSLKPNLILGVLWTENAVAEGQQYLTRAAALDPEYRVARDLIGARFADAPPPRLPSQQDTSAPAPWQDQSIGAASDTSTLRVAADEQQAITAPDDFEAKTRAAAPVEAFSPPSVEIPLAVAAEILVTREPEIVATPELQVAATPEPEATTTLEPETAAELNISDPTLAEIAAAEKQYTAPSRPRSKSDAIPTDAIAAAAAALATSIAADKLKQPAPARRTHPALPKVRPVISGAAEKLPAWLRLGVTPAQASASFETPLTAAERIAPIVTPETSDHSPDWLVQAQAQTQTSDTPSAADDETLPDWLRAAPLAQSAAQSEIAPLRAETVAAAQAELPEWLREPPQPQASSTIAETPPAPTLRVETPPPSVDALAAASSSPPPAAPVAVDAPAEPEPPPARAEIAAVGAEPVAPERITPAEKPLDAHALIELARGKQNNGDLKGALDSYERAMHRRPNHLDEIIGDLQTLLQQPNTPSTAHRLLGEAYAMAGRYKESLEQYRLAMGK